MKLYPSFSTSSGKSEAFSKGQNIRMIGILGRKGVGKDLIADYLVSNYHYDKRSFARPLKRASQVLFGFTDEQVDGSEKEVVDPHWGITPRAVFQWLGTEVFRKQIQTLVPEVKDNFWVELAMKDITTKDKVVISDVRFANEVEAIRRKGGKIIKVMRPGGSLDQHISEAGIDQIKDYDYGLINNGTIKELYGKLDVIMREMSAGASF